MYWVWVESVVLVLMLFLVSRLFPFVPDVLQNFRRLPRKYLRESLVPPLVLSLRYPFRRRRAYGDGAPLHRSARGASASSVHVRAHLRASPLSPRLTSSYAPSCAVRFGRPPSRVPVSRWSAVNCPFALSARRCNAVLLLCRCALSQARRRSVRAASAFWLSPWPRCQAGVFSVHSRQTFFILFVSQRPNIP